MQEPIKNLSPGDIMKLTQSDAGQQLLALLKQEKNDTLKQAMDQAAAGNMDAMKQTLSAFFIWEILNFSFILEDWQCLPFCTLTFPSKLLLTNQLLILLSSFFLM